MSRTDQRFALAPFLLAAVIAMPVITVGTSQALADVTVRVRGDVNVQVGGQSSDRRVRRVRVRSGHRHYRTSVPRVRLRIGGGVHGHVHIGGFAQPPPPPPPPPGYDCDPEPVYGYYPEQPPVTAYAPAPAPAPPPMYVSAAPYQPRLPRLGLGVFAGSINVDDRMSGEDVGLFGRLRLTDAVLLEAEVAKTQMDSARIDRRVGGALLYDLRPRARWSAQLLAGAGVTHVDMSAGTWQSKQEYGELGAGLSVQLTSHLQLAADLRAGARARVDDAPMDQALKSMAPSADAEEKYTRGRVSALYYF